jgi:hypothetical protein
MAVGLSTFTIPLEPTLSKIHKELQRASRVLRTPVCAHSFSKGEKRGTQSTERLKWEEMSRSEKWTRFCETILREGGFAKPRLKFFEIRRDSDFRPAGGCGRNAGRAFCFLAEGLFLKNLMINFPVWVNMRYTEKLTSLISKNSK